MLYKFPQLKSLTIRFKQIARQLWSNLPPSLKELHIRPVFDTIDWFEFNSGTPWDVPNQVCNQKIGLIGMLSNQVERYNGSKLPQHVGPTLRRVALPNGKVNGMGDDSWRNSVKMFKILLVTPHNRYRE